MESWFGPAYARSYAHDTVIAELGGRTAEQALAAGEPAKAVWSAVCVAAEIPAARR
jgi:hypothetical protein